MELLTNTFRPLSIRHCPVAVRFTKISIHCSMQCPWAKKPNPICTAVGLHTNRCFNPAPCGYSLRGCAQGDRKTTQAPCPVKRIESEVVLVWPAPWSIFSNATDDCAHYHAHELVVDVDAYEVAWKVFVRCAWLLQSNKLLV